MNRITKGKNKMKILLIDDDLNLGKVISYQLKQQGYQVDTLLNGTDGLKKFKSNRYDVIISDIQLPDLSGIEVLQEVRRLDPNIIFIVITAFGSVENAVEACKIGANDYLTKPFGKEQLLFALQKAVRLQQLQDENITLKHELTDKFKFNNMIAESGIMQEILRITHRVAQSDASVLILGESGTGKALIARAIHYNSPRRDKPFIVVNCPSIPANLLESELFGHVRGAFTGAIQDRTGKFEQADRGTIFLDEIGDLHEDLQAKLLRVLQEKEFERIGGDKPVKVDVRVIAATHQDLQKLMQEKKFREDLFYRLSVVPIQLPPLRERKEDIPFLVDFFLKKYGKNRSFTLTPEALKVLMNYHWPGNVRELENIIERITALSESEIITLKDIPDFLKMNVVHQGAFQFSFPPEGIGLDEAEALLIKKALQITQGNQSKAARLLKIPRHVLLYRMKKLNIE